MAIVLNRTREGISDTGAGDLTVDGAISGHQTFNAAIGTDRYFYYWIEDGSAWECGIGYLSTSTNFVRDTLIDSSTGSKLVATAAAEIYSEAPGQGQILSAPGISTVYAGAAHVLPDNLNPANQSANVTMTADRVYYIPVRFSMARKLAGLAFQPTNTVGTKLRVGLYQCETDGMPGAIIEESSDIAPTAAIKTFTFSAAIHADGWFYVGIASDDATIVKGCGNTSILASPLSHRANNLNSPMRFIYEDSASWATLPATAAASPTDGGAANFPYVVGVSA
jgi:hypothetical protein